MKFKKMPTAAGLTSAATVLVLLFSCPKAGEPASQQASVLTLPAAVQMALQNNFSIAASEWNTRASQAQYLSARRQRLPSLRARISAQENLDDQRLIPATRPNDPGVYSAGILAGDLILTQPIYTGGRINAEIAAASLSNESAQWRLERQRSELVYDVSATFYRILATERNIEALTFSQRVLREHRARANLLIEQSKAAPVDTLKIDVRIADVEQQLLRERNTLAILQRILANLLGMPDAVPAVSGELSTGDFETPLSDVRALVEAAYQRRGDYRAAQKDAETQAQRLEMARSGRFPTIALQGAWSGRTAATGPNRGKWGDMGTALLVAEMPVFDGGRISARIAEESARRSAIQAQLEGFRQRIQQEVESAFLDRQSARERIRAVATAVRYAEETLSIEREKYQLGRGTVTDVLDAQEALLNAQANQSRALADYHVAAARLTLAVGNAE